MIWLTWRQFRGQFLTALALFAAIIVYLLYVGYTIRQAYDADILACVAAHGCNPADREDRFLQDHSSLVSLPGILLMGLPAVIGIFWGAPLITRELESNTHRLVWNQSVTRARWLAVKLTVTGLISLIVAGSLSLLLTWAASPYDQLLGNRFDALSFPARNVAPLGYVAFAFILGTTVGLFLRRTVAAMAVTLLIVVISQLLIPSVVRPYLRTPVTETVNYTPATREQNGFLNIRRNEPLLVIGYTIPGALMLLSTAELVTASHDKVYASQVQDCLEFAGRVPTSDPNGADSVERCLAERNLHFAVSFQPAARYWSFQWLELAGFLVLAVLLSGLAFWRIRHLRG